VGHVKFVDDYWMTIADIPGLIEGAHSNKGLGFEFLRHIERTKILIFMLDITHKDPLEEYRILENELMNTEVIPSKIERGSLYSTKKIVWSKAS